MRICVPYNNMSPWGKYDAISTDPRQQYLVNHEMSQNKKNYNSNYGGRFLTHIPTCKISGMQTKEAITRMMHIIVRRITYFIGKKIGVPVHQIQCYIIALQYYENWLCFITVKRHLDIVLQLIFKKW